MKFITKHQHLTLVLRASDKIMVGPSVRYSKPLRALFVGAGGGEFDTEAAARKFNWTPDEQRFAEERMLTHDQFNQVGGFELEPGQDLPEWALELAPQESAFDMLRAAGTGCQYVYVLENEGHAEACQMTALSEDVPYCMKHALEGGYEVKVMKPGEDVAEEPATAQKKTTPRRTRPRTKEAATA